MSGRVIVQTRTNRETGTAVTVEEISRNGYGYRRWQTRCDHGYDYISARRADAVYLAAHPTTWCRFCLNKKHHPNGASWL